MSCVHYFCILDFVYTFSIFYYLLISRGPSLDDEEDGGDDGRGGGGAGPSTRKEKTSQQKSGEALVRHMLDQVNGECYSFR